MRIFRNDARKTRGATGDNTGVYRPGEPQSDEAEDGKDHSENPVTMAERSHLFPSRTQQLSSHASKVLGWKRPGRIDCCRLQGSPRTLRAGAFYFIKVYYHRRNNLLYQHENIWITSIKSFLKTQG